MSEVIFQKPWMLSLLPLVGVIIVVFLLRMRMRRQDIQAFGEMTAGHRTEHRSMEPWRLLMLVIATVLIIVALTRPAANPHPKMLQREGRDVVFLLDVSQSMLAEDRLPNRLQSAKASIGECVKGLQDHRMGLVVFAGSSSIVCPLTMDKAFFLNSLEKAGPGSVAHGGTRVGDALIKVCDKLFSDADHGYKDIVLLTDGGDHSEGVTTAVEWVNEKQVTLIAIGLGDEEKGSRIPKKGGVSDYVVYNGQEVWSKLDGAQLRGMVEQADQGAYLAVGTRRMKLGDIYKRISAQEKKQQFAQERVMTYDEIFQVFIAAAFVFLVMMMLIPHTQLRVSGRLAFVVLTAMICLPQRAESADMETADDHFTAGKFREALEMYDDLGNASASARVIYKKANTQYRLARYSEAITSYQEALRRQPEGRLRCDISYNLADTYYRASQMAEDTYAALSWVNQSVVMYRRVLLAEPKHLNAAVNMELVRAERRKLQQQIQQEEKRRQEMKQALDAIRKQLEALILKQRFNLTDTERYLMEDVGEPETRDALIKNERAIQSGTDKLIKRVDRVNKRLFDGIPADASPLATARGHLSLARAFEARVIEQFMQHPRNSLAQEQSALEALCAALEALPRDPDAADDQSTANDAGDDEGRDEAAEGDQGDDGNRESDREGDRRGDAEFMDTPEMNLESIDLPPPNNSPEDVIHKNAIMQKARQAQGAKKKGKPVEKDW
ncbi:MAG: VWA domain-containing protein [Verrucomicrobiae bacterium]|nr:VWA domain-containing protein [Verrucomicrobiae bacterium]NNJ43439.1 VWA domain-containing protein [Akkermansiaceae bacterium]